MRKLIIATVAAAIVSVSSFSAASAADLPENDELFAQTVSDSRQAVSAGLIDHSTDGRVKVHPDALAALGVYLHQVPLKYWDAQEGCLFFKSEKDDKAAKAFRNIKRLVAFDTKYDFATKKGACPDYKGKGIWSMQVFVAYKVDLAAKKIYGVTPEQDIIVLNQKSFPEFLSNRYPNGWKATTVLGKPL